MRIFLSHSTSGADAKKIESIAFKLRKEGHDVFYDRDTIEGGTGFDDHISREIAACGYFVFFISPRSVSGRYAQTELKYAKKKWPNPEGHVLPVMLAETPSEDIPAYLDSVVSILKTRGDFATEVSDTIVARLADLDEDCKPDEADPKDVATGVSDLIDALSSSRKMKDASKTERAEVAEKIKKLAEFIRCNFHPQKDAVLAGARLQRVIGTGNFGTIWEAEDVTTGATVAVKVFRLERLAEGQMLARFKRSIRAMTLLSEEKRKARADSQRGQVVGFHHADDSGLAFSMTLLAGGNLENVDRFGWTTERKIEVMLSVCEAIEYAHRNGVIHRDIKPANIVLNEKQQPVLTDFDISDIKWATSLSTTVEGGLGTPVFAAPEQLENADLASEISDIYSLGRLLYYLLLERSPGYQIEADPSLENLKSHPAALVAIVRRATQFDPKRRYHTVSDMMTALEKSKSGAAAFEARLHLMKRAVRRNWALLLIALLVAGGATTFAFYQRKSAEMARTSENIALENARLAKQNEEAARKQSELSEKLANTLRDMDNLKNQKQNLAERRTLAEQKLAVIVEKLEATPEKSRAYKQLSAEKETLEKEIAEITRKQTELTAKIDALKTQIEKDYPKQPRIKHVSAPAQSETGECDGYNCQAAGLCKFKDGKCVATEEGCRNSAWCEVLGDCKAENGKCVATEEGCRKSSIACKEWGQCNAENGVCVR
jgi:serine/threonine protein kinase